MKNNTGGIMSEKKKQLFGTNGVRGVVGELMTPELVMKIGMAVGQIRPGKVALARDTRTSGPALIQAAKAGLMAVGCDVFDFGILPTPALQYAVKDNFAAGIMITASHNPGTYNGVKVIEPDGTEMGDTGSIMIEELLFSEKFDVKDWTKVGIEHSSGDMKEYYISGIINQFKPGIGNGITVVVDPGCGAAYETTAAILGRLGCRVFTLNAQPDGKFPGRLPEPSVEGLRPLSEMVKFLHADFGIAHDGDADRAVFVDETGRFIEENHELALITDAMCEGKSGIIVTPVSSSRLIEVVAAKHHSSVDYTAVGSIYVARRMRALLEEGKPVLFGGEGNGGLIYPNHQFCRDGGMTGAMMVQLLSIKKTLLSKLVDQLPLAVMLKHKIFTDDAVGMLAAVKSKLSADNQNLVDGVRIDRPDVWCLIRPSGTEPFVRLYVEAEIEETAHKLETEVLSCISSFIRK